MYIMQYYSSYRKFVHAFKVYVLYFPTETT